MNSGQIRELATQLEQLLEAYASQNPEVLQLRRELAGLIGQAKSGQVLSPMEWRDIPGARYFSEGGLRDYRDLEQVFADFRIELTGGE